MVLSVFALVVSLVVLPMVSARNPNAPGPGHAKSSLVNGHLYLCQEEDDGSIVEGGAWGTMVYTLSGPTFEFVFNGFGLEADLPYVLICAPPNGEPLKCLGGGVIVGDIAGQPKMQIQDEFETGDFTDAEILLVPSGDVRCNDGEILYINTDKYLYGQKLISFDDTDDSDEEN